MIEENQPHSKYKQTNAIFIFKPCRYMVDKFHHSEKGEAPAILSFLSKYNFSIWVNRILGQCFFNADQLIVFCQPIGT